MSIEAISWVFKQEIKPSSLKFVLVALADCADPKTGICWPSIDHIVETTCQDRKTVIKSLDDLESRGWLVDTGKRMGKTNQVKVYQLANDFTNRAATKDCSKSTESGTLSRVAGKGSQISAERVPFFPAKGTENGFSPTPPNRDDPSLEPSTDPSVPRQSISSLFEKFWEVFPKQRAGSKGKAYKAYKSALTRSTHEEIYAGVIAYADSDEVKRRFAKGAAAWLNDDRWTDDHGGRPIPRGTDGADKPASFSSEAARIAAGFLNEAHSAGQGEADSGAWSDMRIAEAVR